MADLDDFFAKKDKKRSAKKKFTTSEDLVKKLEKAEEKPKKERVVEQEGNVADPEEDEWKEIEEEQSRDYTGLKIGQLTIADNDSDGYGDEGEGSNQEGENGTETTGLAKGVWNAGTTGASNDPQPKPAEPVSKVYVAPAIKNARLRKGVAPDLSSQEYFPTLGQDKPEKTGIKKGFEEIKHGARPATKQVGNAPVSVENRFNTLSDAS